MAGPVLFTSHFCLSAVNPVKGLEFVKAVILPRSSVSPLVPQVWSLGPEETFCRNLHRFSITSSSSRWDLVIVELEGSGRSVPFLLAPPEG